MNYDWENSIGQWICSTSHALRKALGAQLSGEGITLRQWEVLAWLSCNKGCGSQSELADGLGIEPHTLAGVLGRMERDGLLKRECDARDRRKNRICPTEKAESIWKRVAVLCHDVRSQAIEDVSEEDLATFHRVCEKIRKNLAETEAALATESSQRSGPTLGAAVNASPPASGGCL